ncbi:MAG: hypothetical protein HYU41_19950 [Candidatus Rokubacteria bacterium]|nr:hypothetical protein [Candidatus Rokubacteria bacterium]
MDFGRVLQTIAGFFEQTGYRYAVVGAFGLHAYGMTRGTFDLDFVTESGAQPQLVAFLEALGYETLHASAGYSNHVHGLAALGRVDFIYVSGETGEHLFADCRTMPGPDERPVPVPRPEHLAAMKIQAMKNDPRRTLREMEDVRFLLTLPGINEDEVRGYFDRVGLRDRYDELRRLR